MSKITIIGAGLIGSSWGIVFAKAGYQVCIFDKDESVFDFSKNYIASEIKAQAEVNNEDAPIGLVESIEYTTDLKIAVKNASYIQECIFERLDVKQEIFAALDAVIEDGTVLASSSSGIPSSSFTEELKHRAQCLIAHPVNPPHLIPLVEVVPAPWTDPVVVKQTMDLMTEIGQSPISVKKEIEGFILNRLQGALLNEAWWLYQEGYASVEEIDKTVRDGLSLRWSFMGPFQTIDLNAPGGIVDYADRLAPLYFSIAQSRSDPKPWSQDAIENAGKEIDQFKRRQAQQDPQAWRNEMLRSFGKWRTNNFDPNL
jgi:3-hydroxyacyl-CoA dehydrogenase